MLAESICPPTVDRHTALACCRTRRWQRWLRPQPTTNRLETVWLPYFRFDPCLPSNAGQPAASALLIGGHDSASRWLDAPALANCRPADPCRDELFVPAISHHEALSLSRAAALQSRLTWSTWCRVPALDFTFAGLVHYPFWAYYFARRVGMLDVRLWDGLTGRPAGPAIKAAWLACLQQGPRVP